MTPADNPLELTPEEMASMVDEASERIIDFLEGLSEQPVANTEDATELVERLHEPLPEEPTSFEKVLDQLFNDAIPYSANTPHPGYLVYIPSGGLFHSAMADLIADATNRYIGTWLTAPLLTRIEAKLETLGIISSTQINRGKSGGKYKKHKLDQPVSSVKSGLKELLGPEAEA